MSFRTKRVIRTTPFMMIYEFFLMKYLFLLFGGLDDLYVLLLTVLFGILNIVPMIYEEKKSLLITRILSEIAGFWIWMSLFFFFDILIIYTIGAFIKIPFYLVVAFILLVPIITVYSYYHAHKFIVHENTLELDNLREDINIIHLSDVHYGSIRHKNHILKLRDKIKEIEDDCDLAIISGDLADGSCVVNEDDFSCFKEVGMPIVFTPGNHDFYIGIDNVINACKNAGIIVLDNEQMEFKNLGIFGLTYSIRDKNMPNMDHVVLNPDLTNIIIYHVPYFWEEFSALGFDIQLSGHTHGGQFYPVVNFSNLLFKYNMGLFRNDLGRYLHVTTGVGSMDTPMRWGTDSELVILRLRKS